MFVRRGVFVLYFCKETEYMNTSTRTRRLLRRLSAADTQLVEVATDKLKDKGIDPGDLVLADPHTPPQPGELAISEQDDGKLRIEVANGKRKGGKVVWVLREV